MSDRQPTAEASALTGLAPSVRFPITICVVCYGQNFALAERFLASLYRYTPVSLFSLRAGLNEVEPATASLFADYAARFGNIECFVEPRNIFKNPLMHQMFHSRLLESEWVVWCDDDTHFRRADWLHRLALKIERAPHISMWGMKHKLWRRDATILEWIQTARWYRGVPWMRGLDLEGKEAVEFHFATGGFWAMRAEVVRQLDWPDPRLIHANEDFILGEALRQNGSEIGDFRYGVSINDAPRRNAEAAEVRELRG